MSLVMSSTSSRMVRFFFPTQNKAYDSSDGFAVRFLAVERKDKFAYQHQKLMDLSVSVQID